MEIINQKFKDGWATREIVAEAPHDCKKVEKKEGEKKKKICRVYIYVINLFFLCNILPTQP